MGKIVSFPVPNRVEITTALVHETQTHSASGVSIARHDPPQRVYYLDLVEADGGCLGVWDGVSYDAALAEARDLRAAEGFEIRDLTSETRGRS